MQPQRRPPLPPPVRGGAADHGAAAREHMVETQIASRGVRDVRVLDAMRRVPREAFVPAPLREYAFIDEPLPIGEGQTISQPYVVAYMLQAAELRAEDCVLDVGTGSGYAAAVASLLVRHVHGIERRAALAAEAEQRVRALGYANIEVHVGDGSEGWAAGAPYDAILVAAGAPEVPPALRAQLAVGGRLVLPVGTLSQRLCRIRRLDQERYASEDLGGVAFVPLIGKQGWAPHE